MLLRQLKPCAWYFAKLGLGYAALVALTPLLVWPYASALRSVASLLYSTDSGSYHTQVVSAANDQNRLDTSLVFTNTRTAQKKAVGFNSYAAGYQPMALFIAFVLAAPVSWRRRLVALAAGLLLIQAFVILNIGVVLWHVVTLDPVLASTPPGAGEQIFLTVLLKTLSGWPVGRFLVPIGAGLFLTFRKADWERFQKWAIGVEPRGAHVPNRARTKPLRSAGVT